MKHIISYEELVKTSDARLLFARRHFNETGELAAEIDKPQYAEWWPSQAEVTTFSGLFWHHNEVRIDYKGQELFVQEKQVLVYHPGLDVFWIKNSKIAEKQKVRFMRLLKKYGLEPSMLEFSKSMSYHYIRFSYCNGYGDSYYMLNKDSAIIFDYALIPSGDEEIVKIVLHDNGIWLERTYRTLEKYLKGLKK